MGDDRDVIHVLHVDDDADFADVTAEMLERKDDRMRVETATDAKEGLARLDARTHDCIVSDYDMPERNGIEFLDAVREDHPELPFVLFTGKGSEEIASDAISAGATDYLRKKRGTEQYDLLANRIRNAVEQYRASQRATTLDRVRSLTRDVNQELVRAESRQEAEASICELISDSEPYLFAWIGDVDDEADRIEPRTSAGIGEEYLDDITVTVDESATGRGPGGTAVRQRRVAVSQEVQEDAAFEPWREQALERGYRAVAAVPLEHGDTLYGILAVYADQPDAFDEDERALLAELGDDVAHALHSLELQANLREERTFVDQALDTLNDLFYVVGPDGRLRRWNDRLSEVTGYSDAELEGMQATEFFPEDERERISEAIAKALSTGEAVVEADLLTADGRRIPYEFTGDRLTDADGELRGLIGIGRDVSERKERERRLETLIDSLPGMVYRCRNEPGWPMEHVRGEVEALTGYEPAQLRGDDGIYGSEVVHPDDRDDVWDAVQSAVDASESFELTYRIHTSDGTLKWVWERGQGVYADDGTVEALEGFITDITEQKQYEQELERKNERLEEFTRVASHDLRNPLNVVQERLAMARTECDSEHLDHAVDAVDRSISLLDDLLELAREGEQATDVGVVHLPSVVERCWRNVGALGATLEVETERAIRADASRLQQLFENLFRNAVEHGGPKSTVRVGTFDGGFYVADDGPGIDPEDREQVFEAGYSTAEQGTGFGLDIVEKIADAHDWDVRLTDSETGGTRFEFHGVDVR